MLEQAKDKYSTLIEELENVITTIDKKIKNNDQRKNELIKSYDEDIAKKENVLQELKAIEMNLNYLKRFEGKNVFITVIKEVFTSLVKAFYNAKASIVFLVILLSIYILISFIEPMFVIVLIACFGLLFVGSGLCISFDVKNERKLHSIEDLKNKKKELEDELKETKTRLKNSETVDKSIIQERLKLNVLKEECLKIIEYIRNSRGLAIENLVSNEVLNEVYDNNEALKGVKQRIREIEKEGLV